MSWENLNAFYLSEFSEMLNQFFFLKFRREILDKKVALLLRVLESLLLSLDHSLPLDACQRGLNIETIGVLFIVEFFNSLLSCRESFLDIFRNVKANECKLTIIFSGLLYKYGRNLAILSENLSKLGLVP
jgi:hypothetical protein